MKILIFGSKGWIGNMFINILKENNIEYVEAISRADDILQVRSEICNILPTHIISFIGRTHGEGYTTIDYLEQKGKIYENVRDNLFSPMVLSLLSKKYNFHFTYLGTGCIFEFDNEHPFGEERDGFT